MQVVQPMYCDICINKLFSQAWSLSGRAWVDMTFSFMFELLLWIFMLFPGNSPNHSHQALCCLWFVTVLFHWHCSTHDALQVSFLYMMFSGHRDWLLKSKATILWQMLTEKLRWWWGLFYIDINICTYINLTCYHE